MYKFFLKRLFDLLLAISLIPCLFIIFIVIGPIIYFQDKGPIFYIAPRLGKNGKVFRMYKFRSMKTNAADIRNEDGSTFNSEDDQRLTQIGKFIRKNSLDESPQLLNIIKGDMSFIGPRPDLPEHLELYRGDEGRKLEIRPGITGYNQAYFRNTVPWKDRIKNDIYYIDNISLITDIKIFFKTIKSITSKQGVFIEPSSKISDDKDANI